MGEINRSRHCSSLHSHVFLRPNNTYKVFSHIKAADPTIQSTTNAKTVLKRLEIRTLTSRTWKRANGASTRDLGVHQPKDGSQNWQDSEKKSGKLSQQRLVNWKYETRQRKGNQYGWGRHLHGVEAPLAYVTVERNPSGSERRLQLEARANFSKNGRVH